VACTSSFDAEGGEIFQQIIRLDIFQAERSAAVFLVNQVDEVIEGFLVLRRHEHDEGVLLRKSYGLDPAERGREQCEEIIHFQVTQVEAVILFLLQGAVEVFDELFQRVDFLGAARENDRVRVLVQAVQVLSREILREKIGQILHREVGERDGTDGLELFHHIRALDLEYVIHPVLHREVRRGLVKDQPEELFELLVGEMQILEDCVTSEEERVLHPRLLEDLAQEIPQAGLLNVDAEESVPIADEGSRLVNPAISSCGRVQPLDVVKALPGFHAVVGEAFHDHFQDFFRR